MNALMAKIDALPLEVLGLIQQIAPELAALSKEQQEYVFKNAAYNKLTDKAEKVLTIAGIDWGKEQEAFLNTYQSPHTRRGYKTALKWFENWATGEGINPAAVSHGEVETYIKALKAEGKAALSVRRDIAAVSSFFTFLEIKHDGIKNTFRGAKKRPSDEPKKMPKVPTAEEVEIIITNADSKLAAALSVMAYRGLRCGALAGMSAWGGKYETTSKGKRIRGTLPEKAVKAIQDAGLSLKKPFAEFIRNTNAFEKQVEYHVKRLYKAGKLTRLGSDGEPIIFNCHSMRHFFANTEYDLDKDIHRAKELLDHTNIAITDRYIKSLKKAELKPLGTQ